MTRSPERRPLGRGLSALLDDPGDELTGSGGATEIPIDLIDPNPDQPRRNFKQDELEELAESIRRHGVIQPLILRAAPDDGARYQIIAGERRWRAAQIAGLHAVPSVVRELEDQQVVELAIIENVQRVDLDPVEEARGYTQLVENFGYTQEQLAGTIGKSRSHVANTMRLLALPEQVLDLLQAGTLSAGHARALITATDPVALAEQAVARGLTVRQIEELARKLPPASRAKAPRQRPEKDADTRALEGDLSATIGMRVRLEHLSPDGGGEVRIQYRNLDELDRLCRKLSE
ncbi:MAG TPA: ParB/RepB/Spo0J family partition protein [Paracoccaceae bacterium]|nr:ParB/RepB/Spo0J family partition protein [Paracoccaceae bacterium]